MQMLQRAQINTLQTYICKYEVESWLTRIRQKFGTGRRICVGGTGITCTSTYRLTAIYIRHLYAVYVCVCACKHMWVSVPFRLSNYEFPTPMPTQGHTCTHNMPLAVEKHTFAHVCTPAYSLVLKKCKSAFDFVIFLFFVCTLMFFFHIYASLLPLLLAALFWV